MRFPTRTPVALLLLLALLVWGCSSDDPTGPGDGPDPEPDPDPPTTVTDLSVADVDAVSVTLTWTAPADHDSAAVAAYEIRHGAPGESDWDAWTPLDSPPAPAAPGERETYVATVAAKDADHVFRLRSRDDGDRWSALSNTVTGTTTPDTPHVIRVNVDGSGDQPTIQAAIDVAVPGTLILVGPGTYTWSDQGSGDTHGMIRIDREVQDIELRSVLGAEATVLDAEGRGRVLFIQGYNDGVVVDGFTVTGGVAPSDGYYCGGGIIAHLTSPTIRNCVITGNRAHQLSGEWGGQGGGVWWGGVSAMRLESCVITNNRADLGGGVCFVNSYDTCVISHCVIADNQAEYGGGIGVGNHSLRIEDTLVHRNLASEVGGAIWAREVNPLVIERSTFVRNVSLYGSGLVVAASRTGYPPSEVSVTRSIFALTNMGAAFEFDDAGTLSAGCSVFHANASGANLAAVTEDLGGLLEADPLFCDPEAGLFTLQPDSPCLPRDDCGLIGSEPGGCAGW